MGGGKFGLELTLAFLAAMYERLESNGEGFLITRSPVLNGEDYLFNVLSERYPHIYGEYHDVSDGLMAPEEWENVLGIEKYVHVFLHIKKNEKEGWHLVCAQGDERRRYAF